MRLVLLTIQMLVLTLPLAAQDPFDGYFPPASVDKLRAGKTLVASIPADCSLTLLPAIASRDSIAADVKALQPSIGVEMSRIITGLPQRMDTPQGWLLLYNALHAVSTMKGIPYFSVTRGATHVLFMDSYVLDPSNRKERIPDPVYTTVPAEDVIYTFQEDDAFGKNIYEESYSFRGDHLLVKIQNLSTISFLFLPIIQPHNLVSQVALIPSGNDLAFYGVSYLNTGFPLGDRHSREQSLKNRLVAMADWLKARLTGTGGS